MRKIRANFHETAVVRPHDYRWVPSPMAGVERMMLDRVGGEVARATSIVRYAPNSEFSEHRHDGGEEIYVLAGVFSDEHGDYPAGSYIRNPIGTRHTPRVGAQGATILVKLHQFDPLDSKPVSVFTPEAEWLAGDVDGVEVVPLHTFGREHVAMVRWPPKRPFAPRQLDGGEEIFVLKGDFSDENGHYPAGTWLRLPDGFQHSPQTGEQGASLLIKSGHLAEPIGLSLAG
jgi:anti-sigma factor ChrR (cupin superfamily)